MVIGQDPSVVFIKSYNSSHFVCYQWELCGCVCVCGRFWVRAHPGCPTSVAIVIPLSSNPNMYLLMSDRLLHNSSFGIFASSSHGRTCRRAHVPIAQSEEEANVAFGCHCLLWMQVLQTRRMLRGVERAKACTKGRLLAERQAVNGD